MTFRSTNQRDSTIFFSRTPVYLDFDKIMGIKGQLSGLKQFLTIENSLKLLKMFFIFC